MEKCSYLECTAITFFENLFFYFLFTLPFFFSFWVIWKSKWQLRRIQSVQRATSHHIRFDLFYSFVSFFIIAFTAGYITYLAVEGKTLMYFDASKYGWGWIIVSFFIILFLDDMFFYWAHRAIHHPKLYALIHKVHHESTDPSPFTSFSFHPIEALIEIATALILPLILPMHFGVFTAWQMFSMLNNVLGHLGYELYPKGWTKFPVLRFKTASVHHNMHHQLFNGNYALYFTWWDRWMKTEFKDYESRHQEIFERENTRKNSEGFYILKVSQIQQEQNDAFTVFFDEVPGVFREFSAGQHITLKAVIEGKSYYRTFSLSSIPNAGRSASVTIKKIPGGKVTNYLAENLKAGDELEVSAPSGTFALTPEPANQKHYVMLAGGSGITPLHSMIGAILLFEPKSRITLLYSNRNSSSVILVKSIDNLVIKYPNQISVHYFFTENSGERIGKDAILRIFGQTDLNTLFFYLCGPQTMIQDMEQILTALGITDERIFKEYFTVSGGNDSSSEKSASASVQADIYGKKYSFKCGTGKTLLQSAVDNDIPLPYSCQRGLCGTCRMKCTKGNVSLKNNQSLSEQQIKEGFILTCQAIPVSDEIELHS